MKGWIKLSVLLTLWTAMSALGGCAAAAVNNAAVCRITFDYTDAGLDGLNTQNLRALVAFKEVCTNEQ